MRTFAEPTQLSFYYNIFFFIIANQIKRETWRYRMRANAGSLCSKSAQIFITSIRLNRHLNETSTFSRRYPENESHTQTRNGLNIRQRQEQNHICFANSFFFCLLHSPKPICAHSRMKKNRRIKNVGSRVYKFTYKRRGCWRCCLFLVDCEDGIAPFMQWVSFRNKHGRLLSMDARWNF